MKTVKKWLVFLEVFFLILSRAAFAQSFFGDFDPIKFIFGPDIPSEWYQTYMFMQWLVFPFIGIWLVLFGILEQLGIFRARRGIGAVLALIMALIMSSTGGLVIMARFLFQTMGTWGFLIFVGVFMVGVTAWGWAEMHGRWRARDVVGQFDSAITALNNQIQAAEKAYGDELAKSNPNATKCEHLAQRIRDLEAQKKDKQQAFEARFHG